jgi:hypothetical protein
LDQRGSGPHQTVAGEWRSRKKIGHIRDVAARLLYPSQIPAKDGTPLFLCFFQTQKLQRCANYTVDMLLSSSKPVKVHV